MPKLHRRTRLSKKQTRSPMVGVTREKLYGKRSKGIPKKKQMTIPYPLIEAFRKLAKHPNEWGAAIDFEPGYVEKVDLYQGDEEAVAKDLTKDYEVDVHTHPYQKEFSEYKFFKQKKFYNNLQKLAASPSVPDVQFYIYRKKKGLQHFIIIPSVGKPVLVYVKNQKQYDLFTSMSEAQMKKDLNILDKMSREEARKKPRVIEESKDEITQTIKGETKTIGSIAKEESEVDYSEMRKIWKTMLEKNTGLSFKYIEGFEPEVIPR